MEIIGFEISEEETKGIFQLIDKNGSGRISIEELSVSLK